MRARARAGGPRGEDAAHLQARPPPQGPQAVGPQAAGGLPAAAVPQVEIAFLQGALYCAQNQIFLDPNDPLEHQFGLLEGVINALSY